LAHPLTKEADMAIIEASTPITLKNILYLTDFSQPSEAALPFVVAVARNYGVIVHALHVMAPTHHTCRMPEVRVAEEGMHELDSKVSGIAHKTIVGREIGVWPAVEQAIKDNDVNLIALGTHGLTGTLKLLTLASSSPDDWSGSVRRCWYRWTISSRALCSRL
jgi:nucleotide-binding universal stress UspA family protein